MIEKPKPTIQHERDAIVKVTLVIIHYRFVGSVDIPDAPQVAHTTDTRQGVSVTYEAIAG